MVSHHLPDIVEALVEEDMKGSGQVLRSQLLSTLRGIDNWGVEHYLIGEQII